MSKIQVFHTTSKLLYQICDYLEIISNEYDVIDYQIINEFRKLESTEYIIIIRAKQKTF